MGRVLNTTPWPGTHCTGGWVGPRTGLNGSRKSHPRQAGASVSRPTVHLLRVVMCATGLSSCLGGSLYSAPQLVNVSIQACVCV